MILGEAIRFVRNYLELTQEQVCARANLTQGFYSSIENGNVAPSIDALQRIAAAFDLPMFWLVCYATQYNDIPKKRHAVYKKIKPFIEDILNEIIEKNDP